MTALKIPVTTKDHLQGDENAHVILVEYGDYECPHCGRAYLIVKHLQKHFGEQLGFVFRNFPLTEIHPYAESAAESAEFAAANERFWEMHDGLYENQEMLGEPLLLELAKTLGLSAPGLSEALADEEYAPRVREDFLGGVRSGVNGTPTFFINGQRHDEPFELEFLAAAIEVRLSEEQ
jgi:protein-disulfide isomerase